MKNNKKEILNSICSIFSIEKSIFSAVMFSAVMFSAVMYSAAMFSVVMFSTVMFIPNLYAKEIPVQARVFAGVLQTKPDDLNTELNAQALEEIDSVVMAGVEILFPVVKLIDVGLRYSMRGITKYEQSGGAATLYEAELNQSAYMATIRFSLLKTALFRADAFAGYGGTNTTVKILSASQDGELKREDSSGWFKDTISTFGASVGLGFKKLYFYVEGGVENNIVQDPLRTGNLNTNVNEIDLSGTYILIGLLFDGVSATKK